MISYIKSSGYMVVFQMNWNKSLISFVLSKIFQFLVAAVRYTPSQHLSTTHYKSQLAWSSGVAIKANQNFARNIKTTMLLSRVYVIKQYRSPCPRCGRHGIRVLLLD